jgi:DNA processing protein
MTRLDRLRLAFSGMHPRRQADLRRRYGSAAAVVGALRSGAVTLPEAARAAALRPPPELREALERAGVRAVMSGDAEYPDHLAGVPDAPDVLFVKGRLPSSPGVAVVGTRRSTRYGRSLASAYGEAIASAGWMVVSGLARGIDGAAHRGVVTVGGTGVAILGSGPDVVYPPEHRELHDALLDAGGAVVSEYPPGVPPNGWRFPPRNRIISGLSAAVVVVEAPVTGGALVTAAAALEQGRAVFAAPGDVDRDTSRGCNLLIRDGAFPVLDPGDLIESLSLLRELPRPDGDPAGGGDDPVLAAVGPAGSTLDEICEATGLSASQALSRVARLEVAGLLRRSGGFVVRGR